MESAMQKNDDPENSAELRSGSSDSFKKPLLVGKIGKLPKKITVEKDFSANKEEATDDLENIENTDKVSTPVQNISENTNPVPYKEPNWSSLPQTDGKDYGFEVLKNGIIIETINLMEKPYWVLGRLSNSDICLQHPTISRHHTIIQYGNPKPETELPGFYLYDLNSTHGTFLNKRKIKPRTYVRIQVGHMLKLGCSTRTYILTGPDNDAEEESELTVTELKQKRLEELKRREEAIKEAALKAELEAEERRKKEEERGIDWGIGEDADETADLTENPYAQTNNEELYLDDPKKALRGFFEREGLDLEYDCNEQGMGQFLCKVELPFDDELGRPLVAEVLHKGKKKEAVIQCALEACRILDRLGVLRQATHESKKRKSRNWEENDYYDSDDDTFFDRTGSIESKREKRIQSKETPKVETYESLVEKEKQLSQSITHFEQKLIEAQARLKSSNESDNKAEDSLDTFMEELKKGKPDKQSITKLNLELAKLRKEHANVIRLANIAKPASLPPLQHQDNAVGSTTSNSGRNKLPLFGKRLKTKIQIPSTSKETADKVSTENEMEFEEEEEDEDDAVSKENKNAAENLVVPSDMNESTMATNEMSSISDDENQTVSAELTSVKELNRTMTFAKFEKILKKGLPPFADKHQDKLQKILNSLKKLASSEDRMHVDWKMLTAKKRKVMKLISDLQAPNEKVERIVSCELSRILHELNMMTEQKYKVLGKVKKMGNEIKSISEEIDRDFKELEKEMSSSNKLPNDQPSTSRGLEKTKENKTKQKVLEHENQTAYENGFQDENYSMWVPPNNQTGDGRTSLNEKFGY